MNFLLKDTKQVKFHTDLKDVFLPIRDEVKKYNWLISDYEITTEEVFLDEMIWFTGEELLNIVEEKQIQFIWGSVLGFEKNLDIDFSTNNLTSIADGHNALWSDAPLIQHPDASIEIIAIDSSATVLLSSVDIISRKYKMYYSDAINLNVYNTSLNRQRKVIKEIVEIYFIENLIKKNNMVYISNECSYNLNSYFNILIENIRQTIFENDIFRSINEKDIDLVHAILGSSLNEKSK